MLDRLYQQGSLKLLFPHGADAALAGISLNTAGGATGGDQFGITATAGEDCHLVLTTQAAERAYRAQPGEVAQLSNRLSVGARSRIDWLPQETLLFDHASLRRSLNVDLAGDATALIVEPLVFGRKEMGETLTQLNFRDSIRIRRDGRLMFADETRLTGDVAEGLQNIATGAGCGAMANVLLLSDTAEGFLDRARALMPAHGGVSMVRDGVLFARLLAEDGYALRQNLIPLIELLSATTIPRTWMI